MATTVHCNVASAEEEQYVINCVLFNRTFSVVYCDMANNNS